MTDPIRPARQSSTRKLTSRPPAPAAKPEFEPACPRPRHDGWSADRQGEFLEALAECGCVEEACARVGRSTRSAYALRRREDAVSFRRAWDMALEHAVDRLSDAVFARAIHGVARPVFFKGEQIGERRHYDERLAMFVLRHRDPVRYGMWRNKMVATCEEPDVPAQRLATAILHARTDAERAEAGKPRLKRRPIVSDRAMLSVASNSRVGMPRVATREETNAALAKALAHMQKRAAPVT